MSYFMREEMSGTKFAPQTKEIYIYIYRVTRLDRRVTDSIRRRVVERSGTLYHRLGNDA